MDFSFTRNDDGMSIEEYLEEWSSKWKTSWCNWVSLYLQDDARVWWDSLNHDKMETLSDEEFEQVFLEKWNHAKKKDIKSHKDLCYHSGFDSWVVATETQGNRFKPTFRSTTIPTNLERALSY